jgi:hypothetical protein
MSISMSALLSVEAEVDELIHEKVGMVFANEEGDGEEDDEG